MYLGHIRGFAEFCYLDWIRARADRLEARGLLQERDHKAGRTPNKNAVWASRLGRRPCERGKRSVHSTRRLPPQRRSLKREEESSPVVPYRDSRSRSPGTGWLGDASNRRGSRFKLEQKYSNESCQLFYFVPQKPIAHAF